MKIYLRTVVRIASSLAISISLTACATSGEEALAPVEVDVEDQAEDVFSDFEEVAPLVETDAVDLQGESLVADEGKEDLLTPTNVDGLYSEEGDAQIETADTNSEDQDHLVEDLGEADLTSKDQASATDDLGFEHSSQTSIESAALVNQIGEGSDEENTNESKQYMIERGDSLSSIAQKFLGSPQRWRDIASLNQIQNPDIIEAGTFIALPQEAKNAPDYQKMVIVVKAGDTLAKIAASSLGDAASWKSIWKLNQDSVPNPNRIQVGMQIQTWQIKRGQRSASLD